MKKLEYNYFNRRDKARFCRKSSTYIILNSRHYQKVSFLIDMTEHSPALHETTETQENLDKITYQKILGMILKNQHVTFIVFGIGNITGITNGDTMGRKAYRWNQDTNELEATDLYIGSLDRTVTKQDNTPVPLFKKEQIFQKFSKSILMGFAQNIRGKKDSQFCSDTRGGNRFFAGFSAAITTSQQGIYTTEELNALKNIARIQKDRPAVFIQMMEALCIKFLPAYYRELENIKQSYG